MWSICLAFVADFIAATYFFSNQRQGGLVDVALAVLLLAANILAFEIADRQREDRQL